MALRVLLDRGILLEYGPGIDPADQVFTAMEAEALKVKPMKHQNIWPKQILLKAFTRVIKFVAACKAKKRDYLEVLTLHCTVARARMAAVCSQIFYLVSVFPLCTYIRSIQSPSSAPEVDVTIQT
jgi:hypothetical protein